MKEKYSIIGMTCAACQAHVDKAVRNLEGVVFVNVNLLSNSMEVEYDNRCNSEKILAAVKKAGYLAVKYERTNNEGKNELVNLIVCSILLIILMYISMGHMMKLWLPSFLVGTKNTLIYACSQLIIVIPILIIYRKYFINGYKRLFHLSPNMDSLIALSSTASLVYGLYSIIMIIINMNNSNDAGVMNYMHNLYFESAGMIVVLVSLGKYLESKSKKKTTKAIEKLISLAPDKGIVLRNGVEVEVGIDEVVLGDEVVIKKGMQVPVDGKVIVGSASIDQANLTGESIPVLKNIGDEVLSSTIVTAGYIHIKASKVGENTSISKIIQLVEEASNSKAPISLLADKIAGVFVPFVMLIAFLSFVISLLISKNFDLSFNFGISVLVIACPCSLGLATPVAIMVGTGVGASNGLLIKNAEVLEKSHLIKTICFDKTGTITIGHPEVVDFLQFDYTTDVFGILYSVEKQSEHPLAKAVIDYTKKKYPMEYDLEEYKAVDGQGLECVIENKKYYVGNERMLNDLHIEDVEAKKVIDKFAETGSTVLILATQNEILAILSIKDPIKPTSKEAIKALREEGLEVVMLTGDNSLAANAIAKEVGVSKVIAEVYPEDKMNIINSLKKDSKHLVAMVGDGVNDALALTSADLGIAIGAGSDIAKESSDIILLRNDLYDVLNVILLSKRVLNTIKGNLFWAFLYNCIGIVIASGILYAPFALKLNPMICSLAMSLSSVFVVLNALTINLFKVKRTDSLTNEEIKVKYEKLELQVEGMMCDHCIKHVEEASLKVTNVVAAKASLKSNTVVIKYIDKVNIDEIIKNIEDAGYKCKQD